VTRFDRAVAKRLAFAATALGGVEFGVFYLYWWLRIALGTLQGPDFFSFFAAARLFLARGGAHVYELGAQKQFQDQITAQWPGHFILLPYIHPPYYTLLIAPLGWLPFRTAYLVFGAINLLLAVAAITLLIRGNRFRRGGAVVGAAVAVGFLPLFVTLLQGQSDLLMLLPLTGAYLAWNRGRTGTAGVLAGLALVKPHLVLLIPLLFVARRAWRAVGGFVAVASALSLISVVAFGLKGVLGYLQVVTGWAVGRGDVWPITGQTVYSLRGFLEALPGGRLPALIVLLILLLLVGLSLSWRPDVRPLDMALAIAASVALSPYQNLHDLVLLLVPGFALATLLHRGETHWPNLAAAVVVVAYAGINMTLLAGTWSAALGVLLLAGYLVAERLAVRPEPIPLPNLAWTGPRPHRVIVLPAYRAARTLVDVVGEIPAGHADRILLVDDASKDATVSVATALKLDVIRHPRNLGYGGNQKTCYSQALAMGADVVVMLHPDGQYDPAIIPRLCAVIERGEADLVLGSRWLDLNPAKAGMPWWKRIGNRFLTFTENKVLGLDLSEYHTGYRAYSRRFLEAVPFLQNSNDFVFDTQILIQAATFGFKIGEVQAVGRYFEEMSSIGLKTSIVYGLKTLVALTRYVLHRAGFTSRWLLPPSDAHEQPLSVGKVAHHSHVH
jgi:hypothetical protein